MRMLMQHRCNNSCLSQSSRVRTITTQIHLCACATTTTQPPPTIASSYTPPPSPPPCRSAKHDPKQHPTTKKHYHQHLLSHIPIFFNVDGVVGREELGWEVAKGARDSVKREEGKEEEEEKSWILFF